MKKLIKIIKPNYCRCCWRPITEKNKRGGLERYCALHKPSGRSKSEYMRSRRKLNKWVSQQEKLFKNGKTSVKHSANIDELVSTLVADPAILNIDKIKEAKALIAELLRTTSASYPHSYEKLKPIAEHVNATNLTFYKVILLTHFKLGTEASQQLEREAGVYDLKKESEIWFTQLLFTIARFETLATIATQTSLRSVRSDKSQELRSVIEKELDLAKSNNKKPNQTTIAKKLELSKQRIGQLVKELHGIKKGDRKGDR
jgi:hypothetical protein